MKRVLSLMLVVVGMFGFTMNVQAKEFEDEYITEVVIGVVLNEQGDGAIIYDTLLDVDYEYNYISYRYVDDIQPGDIVQSTFVIRVDEYKVYDDIIDRYDDVIWRED